MTPKILIKALTVGAVVLAVAFWLALGPIAFVLRLLLGGETGI